MRKITKFVVLMTLVLMLVACSSTGQAVETPANESGELEKIVVSEMRGASWMPVYSAEMLGYFEEEGLDVEFIVYKDGPIAFQGMHAGDSQFCMLSTEPVLRASEEGLKSTIILPTVKNKQYMFAISKDLESVSDLKGKAIFGGMPGSAPYSFVLSLLSDANVDKNDVEWINMEYGAALAALDNGSVAGAYFDSIYMDKVNNIGGKVVIDTSNAEDHKRLYGTEFYESQMVVVTEEFAQSNPETVQKFVNAVVRAIDWQNKHTDEEIVALVQPMFEGEDLSEIIGILRKSLTEDGNYSEEGYEAIEGFCLEQGILKESIGYENIIDMSFVKKAWEALE